MSLPGSNNPPPLIWAFDIATNMGVAEGYAGERPILTTIRLSKPDDDAGDAFARALKYIATKMQGGRPDRAYIEAPIPGMAMQGKTNADAIARLWGLAACIEGALRCKNIMVRRANIQAVRKRFIGHGNLKGPEAKRRTVELCNELGWEPPNHDAADAAAVWHFGVLQTAPRLAVMVEPLLWKINKGANNEGAES
jgi:hypothetical protein